jgi:hypothetical protein
MAGGSLMREDRWSGNRRRRGSRTRLNSRNIRGSRRHGCRRRTKRRLRPELYRHRWCGRRSDRGRRSGHRLSDTRGGQRNRNGDLLRRRGPGDRRRRCRRHGSLFQLVFQLVQARRERSHLRQQLIRVAPAALLDDIGVEGNPAYRNEEEKNVHDGRRQAVSSALILERIAGLATQLFGG